LLFIIYQKLPFLKKGKKKAPSPRSFPFKKAVVYIFSTKKYDIRNGAKWNLRKDYEYNIIKKLIHKNINY